MNAKMEKGPQKRRGNEPFWLSPRARRQLASCLTKEEIDSFCSAEGEVDIDQFIAVVTPSNSRLSLGSGIIAMCLICVVLAYIFAPAWLAGTFGSIALLPFITAIYIIVKEHRDNVRRAKALGRVYGLSSFRPYRGRVAAHSKRYRGYFEFRDTND